MGEPTQALVRRWLEPGASVFLLEACHVQEKEMSMVWCETRIHRLLSCSLVLSGVLVLTIMFGAINSP